MKFAKFKYKNNSAIEQEDLNVTVTEISNNDIAVVGVSARLPVVNTIDEFWIKLRQGDDFVQTIPDSRKADIQNVISNVFGPEALPGYMEMAYLNEIDKFDHNFFGISPREARLMDPNQRLFLETAWSAIEDAGYGGNKLYGTRTGVYVGVVNPTHHYSELVKMAEPDAGEEMRPGNLTPIIAARIGYLLNFKGPNMVVDTACSSSMTALHLACQAIKAGECRQAIVGGVMINPAPLLLGEKRVTSSSDGRTHTFDDAADGTGIGEGIIALMIKPLQAAQRANDDIYAVIKGTAANYDGKSIGITAPNAVSQADVIERAWKVSNIDPETISYIEAHGTATSLGDPIEIDGLTKAFRRYTQKKHFCAIGSVKANIGHLQGAAGLAGILKCILSLKNSALPPQIHFEQPNRKINFEESPFYINYRLNKWETQDTPRRCGVSSFGISGTNVHVILEAPPEKKKHQEDDGTYLFTLSAKSKEQVFDQLKQLDAYLDENPHISLADLCYTLNTGRGHYEFRCAFPVSTFTCLKTGIAQLLSDTTETNDTVFFNHHKIAPLGKRISAEDGMTLDEKAELSAQATASLIHFCKNPGKPELIRKAAQLYVQGGDIDFTDVYAGKDVHRVHLPTYVFARTRCWVKTPASGTTFQHALVPGFNMAENTRPQETPVTLTGGQDNTYSDTQKRVAAIWGEALGLDCIDLHANFYALGGDSLIGLRIVNNVNQVFRTAFKVATILKHITIADFSGVVEKESEQNRTALPDITPVSHGEYFPVSFAQRRFYILWQLNRSDLSYNLPCVTLIEGDLDIKKFQRTFKQIIERHEAFRSSFHIIDDAIMQKVHDHVDLPFVYEDAGGKDVKELAMQFISAFDLSQAPLVKVALYKLAEKRYVFMYDLHHIIFDGVSMEVLLNELVALYTGQACPLPSLNYKDFAVWQRAQYDKGCFDEQEKFWINHLNGILPVLSMPIDFPRPKNRSYRGGNVEFTIDAALVKKLTALSRNHNATLNMVFTAFYYVLLSFYSGQRDIVIGSIVSGREKSSLENIIGVFANFLPVRINLGSGENFSTILDHIKSICLDVLDNQNYPFDCLIEKLKVTYQENRNPLYDTMIILHNQQKKDAGISIPDQNLKISPFRVEDTFSTLDLKLDLFFGPDGTMEGVFEYASDLYRHETVTALADHFIRLIDLICTTPEKCVQDLGLFSPETEKDVIQKREKVPENQKDKLPVVVASTFTCDPVEHALKYWSSIFNLDLDVIFAPYNQVFQELLTPESDFNLNTGVNILLVRFEDFIRDFQGGDHEKQNLLENTFNRLITALQGVEKNTPLFFVLFPPTPAITIGHTLHACINMLNQKCRDAFEPFENLYIVDLRHIDTQYSVSCVFDDFKNKHAHIPFTEDFFHTAGTCIARSIVALKKPGFKVIALDCDNTLWQGVLGEDGMDGIRIHEPYKAFQNFLLQKKQAGFVLVLCSKNNEHEVLHALDHHPDMLLKKDDFVTWRINWEPKSGNLKSMAEEINLSLESFIFIDDSPAEINEVILNAPDVLSLLVPENADRIPEFLDHIWAFDKISITDEDKKRSMMYQQEVRRNTLRSNHESLETFLMELEIQAAILKITPDHEDRASQLTLRTNQFNMSTKRRTQDQIRAFISAENHIGLVVRARDKFGDYGIIGVVLCVIKEQDLFLDSYMLSCRAMGRGIENAILVGIKKLCHENSLNSITADFLPTEKNTPFKLFIEKNNWVPVKTHDDRVTYFIDPETIQETSCRHIDLCYMTDLMEKEPDPDVREVPDICEMSQACACDAPDTGDIIDWTLYKNLIADMLHQDYLHALECHSCSRISGAVNRTDVDGDLQNSTESREYTETENRIVSILQQVLKNSSITLDDNYFDKGGDSLKAVTVISRIHSTCRREIGIADLFSHPTARELALFIESLDEKEYFAITPAPLKENYHLSSAQKRLFIIHEFDKTALQYNMPFAVTIKGPVDKNQMEKACIELISRHEILRTSFAFSEDMPVQKIHDHVDFSITCIDVSESDSGSDYNVDTEAIAKEFIQPFVLSRPPLFRVCLVRLGKDSHLLLVDMHHIISDGMSLGIMIRELAALYKGDILPELKMQYKDFAEWQHERLSAERSGKSEAFWLSAFSGEIPKLNLPYDFPRPGIRSYKGHRIEFNITGSRAAKIKKLAAQENTTLFVILLAVINLWLSKLTGQEEVVVGTPVAGRGHEALENIMGMFVNTLALKHFPKREMTFKDFLDNVKKRTLSAFAHQDYPFERLVEKVVVDRDLTRNPIFDVMFTLQNWDFPDISLAGLDITMNPFETRMSMFDLSIECFDLKDQLSFNVTYCTDLFKQQTVEKFIAYFNEVVDHVLDQPSQTLAEIEIISKQEKNLILNAFNDTAQEYPADKTVVDLFHEQVAVSKDKTAVVYEDTRLTFHELNQQADRMAFVLRCKGVGPETVIGLIMDRSLEMVIAIIGILKAGGAYLPIDPSSPLDRKKYILKHSGAKVLVTSDKTYFMDDVKVCIDINEALTTHEDIPAMGNLLSESALAYVIYTSGSTGEPKGVQIEHGSIVNLVYGLKRRIFDRYNKKLNISLMAAYVFDASVQQIFGALLHGHTLYIVPEAVKTDGQKLLAYYTQHNIDISDCTPAHLQLMLMALREDPLPVTVKQLIVGGDVLSRELVNNFTRMAGDSPPMISNIYGLTECCVDSTLFDIHAESLSSEADTLPIGSPLPNQRIYILGQDGNLQPVGLPGELCISGKGVGRGYLHANGNAKGRFINHPIVKNQMLYRTGDMAKWREDGNIRFIGRLDSQVKIRGFRVDIREIEKCLLENRKIREAVVMVKEQNEGDKVLCAFLVLHDPFSVNDIRAWLAEKLPHYMIPSQFVILDHLPLTVAGKIDKNQLSRMGSQSVDTQYVAPLDKLEKDLALLWADILNIKKENIGRKTGFFELGGHSLAGARLVLKMRKKFNVNIPLIELFKTPTIEGLANLIRMQSPPLVPEIDNDCLILLKKGKDTQQNVFFIHESTGIVEVYMELCNNLSSNVNCWGIQSDERHFDKKPDVDIEKMADNYIEWIKAIQPSGPYMLAGFSFGGVVAFEIVRKLEERDEKVVFFAMIDSMLTNGRLKSKKPSEQIKTKLTYFSAGSLSENKKIWENFTCRSIQYIEIKGDHHSILKLPGAIEIAKIFDKGI